MTSNPSFLVILVQKHKTDFSTQSEGIVERMDELLKITCLLLTLPFSLNLDWDFRLISLSISIQFVPSACSIADVEF